MYFVAMTLQLIPQERRPRWTTADSVYANAAIIQTISGRDPHLGRMLHDIQRHKRMSLAIVCSNERTATLRLTFVAEEGLASAHALVSALAANSVLRLGRTICDVESVDFTNSEWAGVGTWADLLPQRSSPYIRFAFATPTAIMKRDGVNGRFTALFPTPLDIFSGLTRRWSAMGGPVLPDDLKSYIQTGGCVVSDYCLRTERFTTKERTQIGFVGWVMYECRNRDPERLIALNALARLAFYTGVGYQTARGMGAVKTTFPLETP